MPNDVNWIAAALIGGFSAGVVKLVEHIITWKFDEKKQLDQQRDDDVEIIERVVFEVRDLATNYWSRSGKDSRLEGAVSGRLMFVGQTVEELLGEKIEILREAQVLVNRFDQACSGGSFGTSARVPEGARSASIEIAAYRLVHGVSRFRRAL